MKWLTTLIAKWCVSHCHTQIAETTDVHGQLSSFWGQTNNFQKHECIFIVTVLSFSFSSNRPDHSLVAELSPKLNFWTCNHGSSLHSLYLARKIPNGYNFWIWYIYWDKSVLMCPTTFFSAEMDPHWISLKTIIGTL